MEARITAAVADASGMAGPVRRSGRPAGSPGTASRRRLFATVVMTAAGFAASAAEADQGGFGTGNWGGNRLDVGRTSFYANGLVSNRLGETTFFNNGLVARQYGRTTLYSNGLVSGQMGRTTYFSNLAVGVPMRGGMVYGGGYPYPQGPGPQPFGPAAARPSAAKTPWDHKPWNSSPWGR